MFYFLKKSFVNNVRGKKKEIKGHSTVFFCHGVTDMAHCFEVKIKTIAYISFIFGMIFNDYTRNNIQQQKLNLGEKNV